MGYAVLTKNVFGDAVPVGLVLLSLGFPALDDHREKAVFLWYLTAAPMNALERNGVSVNPRLLEVLVDIALVVSETQGFGGRIGLHAADEDGNPASVKLFEAYKTRCRLLSLPKDANMPGIVRKNDGRYFYTTPLLARERMAALDDIR